MHLCVYVCMRRCVCVYCVHMCEVCACVCVRVSITLIHMLLFNQHKVAKQSRKQTDYDAARRKLEASLFSAPTLILVCVYIWGKP